MLVKLYSAVLLSIIFFLEVGVFFIAPCRWDQTAEGVTRIVVIADPQLTDKLEDKSCYSKNHWTKFAAHPTISWRSRFCRISSNIFLTFSWDEDSDGLCSGWNRITSGSWGTSWTGVDLMEKKSVFLWVFLHFFQMSCWQIFEGARKISTNISSERSLHSRKPRHWFRLPSRKWVAVVIFVMEGVILKFTVPLAANARWEKYVSPLNHFTVVDGTKTEQFVLRFFFSARKVHCCWLRRHRVFTQVFDELHFFSSSFKERDGAISFRQFRTFFELNWKR